MLAERSVAKSWRRLNNAHLSFTLNAAEYPLAARLGRHEHTWKHAWPALQLVPGSPDVNPMRVNRTMTRLDLLAALLGLLLAGWLGVVDARAAGEIRQPIAVQFAFDLLP